MILTGLRMFTYYEADKPAVFDRNANGWITVPAKMKLPKGQQERHVGKRTLIKFQMSSNHPLVALKKTYVKGDNFKLKE